MSRFQRRVISLAGAFGLASVFLAGCTIEPIAGPVLPYGPSPIGAEYYGDYGDFGGFGDGYFVGPFGYGGRRYAGFHGNHAWHRAAGVRSIPSIPGGGFRGGVRRAGGFRGGGGRPHAGGGIRR
jgi:hypothetical protein